MRLSVDVIGLGNELRGDDGAGLEVVRLIRARGEPAGITLREQAADPMGLLDAWQDAGAVVLVDTMRSGARPGTVRRMDASSESLPEPLRTSASTHAASLGEVIELARVLGRLPARVIVYGVEGRRFEADAELSGSVRAALDTLAATVLDEALTLASGA